VAAFWFAPTVVRQITRSPESPKPRSTELILSETFGTSVCVAGLHPSHRIPNALNHCCKGYRGSGVAVTHLNIGNFSANHERGDPYTRTPPSRDRPPQSGLNLLPAPLLRFRKDFEHHAAGPACLKTKIYRPKLTRFAVSNSCDQIPKNTCTNRASNRQQFVQAFTKEKPVHNCVRRKVICLMAHFG
jgi:hypothetical protein